jgi:hypothetical protein
MFNERDKIQQQIPDDDYPKPYALEISEGEGTNSI